MSQEEDDDGRNSRSNARGDGAAGAVGENEGVVRDLLPRVRGALHEVTRAAGHAGDQGLSSSPHSRSQSQSTDGWRLRCRDPISVSVGAEESRRGRRSATSEDSEEVAVRAESRGGSRHLERGALGKVPHDVDRGLWGRVADLGGAAAQGARHRQRADGAPDPGSEAG